MFKNYQDYTLYISKNWDITYKKNKEMIDKGLLIDRGLSLNGEPYRMLSRDEFELYIKKLNFC